MEQRQLWSCLGNAGEQGKVVPLHVDCDLGEDTFLLGVGTSVGLGVLLHDLHPLADFGQVLVNVHLLRFRFHPFPSVM